MKQNRYKALEQEFKDATLDLDDFLNMDEIEKQDYLDFLREKEAIFQIKSRNAKLSISCMKPDFRSSASSLKKRNFIASVLIIMDQS